MGDIGAARNVRWRVRIAELTVGFATSAAMNWGFDWLLYPYAIWKLGLVWGGSIMSVLSLLSCLALLWLYDLLKRDWLGIEAVKRLRDEPTDRRTGGLVARLLRKGDAVTFVALSVQFDPFITVAYLRRGRWNGMSRREWGIFLGSWMLGNGSWMIACYLGVSMFEWLWQLV